MDNSVVSKMVLEFNKLENLSDEEKSHIIDSNLIRILKMRYSNLNEIDLNLIINLINKLSKTKLEDKGNLIVALTSVMNLV